MPAFKSKAQFEHFRKMEDKGELAAGTTDAWMKETPHFESLPIRKHPKQPEPAKKNIVNVKQKTLLGYE